MQAVQTGAHSAQPEPSHFFELTSVTSLGSFVAIATRIIRTSHKPRSVLHSNFHPFSASAHVSRRTTRGSSTTVALVAPTRRAHFRTVCSDAKLSPDDDSHSRMATPRIEGRKKGSYLRADTVRAMSATLQPASIGRARSPTIKVHRGYNAMRIFGGWVMTWLTVASASAGADDALFVDNDKL